MMITRLLTFCAVVAAGATAASLVQAQQVYPPPPGTVYSPVPAPYPHPPGGYPGDYRRGPGASDFDSLEDDEGNVAALPPPGPPRPKGPILPPVDPAYARAVRAGPTMPPVDPL